MLSLPDRVYWFRVLMGIVAGVITASMIGSATIIEAPDSTIEDPATIIEDPDTIIERSDGLKSENSTEIAFRGITILMFMYVVSYYLAKFVVAPQMPKEQSRKWATAGIGAFIALFFWTWILITTLNILPI